jgi:hypothetical protein
MFDNATAYTYVAGSFATRHIGANMARESNGRIYEYVRIGIQNAMNKYSTISILPKKHDHLLQLARGSSCAPSSRVTAVCRESALELHKSDFTGKLSSAVYEKALHKLRGSFIRTRADTYDNAQLPDGIEADL